MSGHTPEPWTNVAFGEGYECDDWRVDNDTAATSEVAAISANGKTVALVVSKAWSSSEFNENIRRIVACVNACAGIPTEIIESWMNPPEGQLGAPHGTWASQLAEVGRQQVEMQKRIDRLLSIAKTFRSNIGGALWAMDDDDRELAVSVDSAIAEAEAAA